MRLTSGITLFGSSIFVPVMILGVLTITNVSGVFHSPALHAVLECVTTVVGLLFGYFCLQGFWATGSRRLIMAGMGLSVAAFLLFLHTVTFPGMSLPLSSSEGTMWFSTLAHALLAIFLFLAASFEEHIVPPTSRTFYMMLSVAIVFLLVILSAILTEQALLQGLSVASSMARWTPLGKFLHLMTMVFLALSSIRYLHGAFLIRSEISLLFATGIVLLLMAEITMGTSYGDGDIFFWMGHVWRAFGSTAFFFGILLARNSGRVPVMDSRKTLPATS